MVTFLRKLLCVQEIPPFGDIFKKTKLLKVIETVLIFEVEEGDVFHMKLEAYWIVVNLACCNTSETKILLGDDSENGIA